MKVIVTGSGGFIGKRLVAALRRRGDEVVGIDRLNGDEAGEISAHLTGVDFVYHLAAQTSVFNGDLNAIERDNIAAFITVCTACAKRGVPLVYASSSTAINTTSLYGLSKRFDEDFAALYHPGAIGVRLHNVYGPSPRQGTLLWHLMSDDKVTLYNGGRNLRHFTYVDDAVAGLMAAERLTGREQLANIANPELTSTLDFARAVAARNGVRLELNEECRPLDKVVQRIDRGVYTIPLPYKSYIEGVRLSTGG